MKYLREFETTAAYEAAKSSLVLPNISICDDEPNGVQYNPYVPEAPKLVCVYTITQDEIESDIKLISKLEYSKNCFETMKVDGIMLDAIIDTYRFETVGNHTVEYTLKNETYIEGFLFTQCTNLTSINIPSTVTDIGDYAFNECNLSTITCNAMTAPSTSYISTNADNGTLYVPVGSTGYDAWFGEYGVLGEKWTKVEF